MIKLEQSEVFKRKMRQDDVPDLAIPTFTLAIEAMRSGKIEEAAELIEYGCAEDTRIHDTFVAIMDAFCTRFAEFGEEEVEKAWRHRNSRRDQYSLPGELGVDTVLQASVETLVQRGAETQRSHHGNITVSEERDRYVVRCDPCGSGGRLRRRSKDIGVTKKAYPWSWGRVGVPYYCCHCAIVNEIEPIEARGYPIRVTIPGDRPEDPCIHYYYKKPELIPEEYFTRVGKNKTIE
jgi:hypothetical protein